MATQDTIAKLQAGGAIPEGIPLPRAYQEVLADLSPEQVNTLLAIKQRLDTVADDPEVQQYSGELLRTNRILG